MSFYHSYTQESFLKINVYIFINVYQNGSGAKYEINVYINCYNSLYCPFPLQNLITQFDDIYVGKIMLLS